MRANLITGLVTGFLVGLSVLAIIGLFALAINCPDQALFSFMALLSLGSVYGLFLAIRNVVERFFED